MAGVALTLLATRLPNPPAALQPPIATRHGGPAPTLPQAVPMIARSVDVTAIIVLLVAGTIGSSNRRRRSMDVRRRAEDVALHVDVDRTMRRTMQANEYYVIAAEVCSDALLWLGRAWDLPRVPTNGALAAMAGLPRLLLWYAIIGIGAGAYVNPAGTLGFLRSVAVDRSPADLYDVVATVVPSLLFQSAVVMVRRQATGGNSLGPGSRLGTALAEALSTRLQIRSEVETEARKTGPVGTESIRAPA